MSQSQRLLRIFHGAGREWEIDAEVAAGYSGTTEEALRAILRDHAEGSEAVLAELDSPDRILELYRDTPDGVQEEHLSPETNWDEIAQQLAEDSLYIGIARWFRGGAD